MFSIKIAPLHDFIDPLQKKLSNEKHLSAPRICVKMPRERSELKIRITSPYRDFHGNH